MNSNLIDILAQICKLSEISGSVYREKAYRKAVEEIKKVSYIINKQTLPKFLETKIPSIGNGIKSKIAEFINTGVIEEVEKLKKTKEYNAYLIFSKISGVGPATIRNWINLKLFTIADLKSAVKAQKVILNNMQKYGLMYYDDLNDRIPRDEVQAVGQKIQLLLKKISREIIFTIAGSYRRGLPYSGDIDILISTAKYQADLLPNFINMLPKVSGYINVLSKGKERVTFLYRSEYSGKVRQIDILNLEYSKYWSGILYFTGDFGFNESMRGYAKHKGFRLNQNGLYKIVQGKMQLIPAFSEKDIFAAIGLVYIPPEDRNGLAIHIK